MARTNNKKPKTNNHTTMRKTIDNLLGSFLAILLAVMTINVLWQVFSRYVLKTPSSITDELARFLLIWIGVLGAAYASGQNLHLAIDLLPDHLSAKGKRRLQVFINLLIATFALTVFVIGGSRLVYITFYLGQKSAALQIPLGVVYSILPVSGLLIIYYKISNLFYKNKDESLDKKELIENV